MRTFPLFFPGYDGLGASRVQGRNAVEGSGHRLTPIYATRVLGTADGGRAAGECQQRSADVGAGKLLSMLAPPPGHYETRSLVLTATMKRAP
jgi:hypothetical protein